MYKIIEMIMAAMLVWLAYEDWKTKKVPVIALGFMLFIAVLSVFGRENVLDWDFIFGILVGMLFLLVSKWTGEAIGYGDSWIILALGIYLGGKSVSGIVLVASFFAGIYSLACYLCFKRKAPQGIPFVPFITLAYIGSVCL